MSGELVVEVVQETVVIDVDLTEINVIVDVLTHPADNKRKWNYTDLVNGKIKWDTARNARWGQIVPYAE